MQGRDIELVHVNENKIERQGHSYSRINPLDLPNGDIYKARQHGEAHLLYKIDTEKLRNSIQGIFKKSLRAYIEYFFKI